MSARVDELAPIGLDALVADAALLVRMERKYIVPVDAVDALVERLAETHGALEIDGRRRFAYRTTYYDTPDLLTAREHRQRRRRRFKLRRRRYVDSGQAALEVKLKDAAGRVFKHVLPTHDGVALLPQELEFFRERVQAACGRELAVERLEPVLETTCRRITLAAPDRQERLTIDLDLDLAGLRLSPGFVVVESKSRNGRALADRALLGLGIHPARRCSKYCLGVAHARPEFHAADVRPLRRFFDTAAA